MSNTPTTTRSESGFKIEAYAYAYGGRAWLATVRKGGQFGIERNFGSKHDVTTAKSNKYRDLQLWIFCLAGDQIEFACQESSTRNERSYFKVSEAGELIEIRRQDIA